MRNGRDQVSRILVLRRAENPVAGFFLDHEAPADHRDIIGNARYQSKVVGDIECGDLGFLAQAIE